MGLGFCLRVGLVRWAWLGRLRLGVLIGLRQNRLGKGVG